MAKKQTSKPAPVPAVFNVVGENILDQLIDRLGETWNMLESADRKLIAACAADAGVLAIAAMTAPQTHEAQQRLLREKAQIHAQLMNIASAEALRVATEFWNVVKSVVQGAVAIVFAAV